MAYSFQVSNAQKYKGAGTFKLERLTADGTPSTKPEDIYTAGQNLIGVINTAWSLTTEELRDENNEAPRAIYNTGTQETIGLELRSEDPYLDLFLKGGKIIEDTVGVQEVADIPAVIPDDGKYTIKAPDGTDAVLDDKAIILVRDLVTNRDYKKVTAPPQEGEYSVDTSTGEFTFDVADKGKRIYISAGFMVADAVKFQRDKNSALSSYRLTLGGVAMQYDQTNEMYSTEVYPSVQVASGELASMARQLSPASTKTINFQRTASGGAEGSSRTFSPIPVDMNQQA